MSLIDKQYCAGNSEAIRKDQYSYRQDIGLMVRSLLLPETPPLLSQEEAFQRAVKAGLFAGLVSKPGDTTL